MLYGVLDLVFGGETDGFLDFFADFFGLGELGLDFLVLLVGDLDLDAAEDFLGVFLGVFAALLGVDLVGLLMSTWNRKRKTKPMHQNAIQSIRNVRTPK